VPLKHSPIEAQKNGPNPILGGVGINTEISQLKVKILEFYMAAK